jgi:hypothetical protein
VNLRRAALTASVCLNYHVGMFHTYRAGRVAAALLLMVGAAHSPARACSVPVFRYALERWKPSPYQLTVFHRGPWTEAERLLVKQLEDASATANLKVDAIDLNDKLTPEQRTLWQLRGGASLPRVIVRYPEEDEEAEPASVGPLDEAYVRSLLDSPARRRLVDYLCQGESAVWILLESGDRAADERAGQLLETELARLQTDLKLPEQDERDLLSTKAPLKIAFAVLRVSRSDPSETRLVEMLLGGEEGLDKVTGPIAFPVFGRGRVRLALHGERLRPTEIERWASSLCGPCSCVVKELNPGFDLMLTAAWEDLLELAPSEGPAKTPAAPAIPPGATTPGDAAGDGEESTGSWWMAGAAGLLVVVTAALALRDRRSAVS